MTPVYDLNSPPSPFPFLELKEDQHLQFFIPPHQASSSLSSQIFFNIPQDESATGPSEQKMHHHKADKYILHGGSRDDHRGIASSSSSSSQPTIDCAEYSGELSTVRELKDENRRENEPAKWMPLKMRVMRKMINESCDKQEITVMHKFRHQQGDYSETSCPTYNCGNLMRACSDCNTTKTPLWRSGPQGPKSLCNACGIRQRKARRAMAAAANGMVIATDNSTTRKYKVQNKGKKSRSSFTVQYKKPFKLPASCSQSGGKSSFEDFAMSLSKKFTIGQAFPKDEEEAAILLMALSCGLLHG